MSLDGTGLRILTRAECLHRLPTVTVGHLAMLCDGAPMILPVHFSLGDDETIRFRARPGTTVHGATDGSLVAFEADGPVGASEPVWTVVVHGLATHHTVPWPSAGGTEPSCVELRIDDVSGREVLDRTDPMAPVMAAALPRW
jgi:hypothetical protein